MMNKPVAQIEAQFKRYDLKVRDSAPVTSRTPQIAGLGEVPGLIEDSFQQPKSPIDLKAGGTAKIYRNAQGTIVAAVIQSESAKGKTLTDQDIEKTIERLRTEKARAMMETWMKEANTKAKIKRNEALLNQQS